MVGAPFHTGRVSRHRVRSGRPRFDKRAIFAVVLVVAGVFALAAMVYWQETRQDEYGRDVGCALAEVRGADSDDCDD